MSFIVAYMCENNNDLFFRMSLDSTLGFADRWVVVDGGSNDGTIQMVQAWAEENNIVDKVTIVSKKYLHNDKGADGHQRNQYLKYVDEGDWVLVLDSDELLSDNGVFLRDYAKREQFGCFDIQMVHFIYNFGMVDATLDKHFVQRRFFKYSKELSYPESEHNVLNYNDAVGQIDDVIIWHLGYVRDMQNIIRKYQNNKKKSNIHNAAFLKWWKDSHIFGKYPVKGLDEELFNKLPWGVRDAIKD